MVCKATNFEGPLEANKPLENWSGEVKFTASQYFEPAPGASTSPSSGLDSLVLAVSMATAQGRHITPMGSRWSFENMVQTDDWAVSLAQLDRRLDHVIGADGTALTDAWRQRQLDAASTRRLLHVEAGIEVGALSEMLDANPGEPWALPTLGGANGQSLAGVISTSTHGLAGGLSWIRDRPTRLEPRSL
jgi:FAD/FMN-containing dehydrogenase